jgi:hypothetical protein
MERDRRLTGTLRGQTDKPEAPLGFELNNPWKVCATLDTIIHKLTRDFSWKHAFPKQQDNGLERVVIGWEPRSTNVIIQFGPEAIRLRPIEWATAR